MIYILGSTLNTVGGSNRFILDLIYILRKQGYKVGVIGTEKTNWNYVSFYMSPPTVEPDKEYSVFPFFNLPLFGIYQRLVSEWFLKFLKATVNQDDILINSLGMFTPICGVHINYVHGVGYLGLEKTQYENAIRRLYSFPYKVLTSSFDNYVENQEGIQHVANSKYTLKRLEKMGIRNIGVIYPPVATNIYSRLLNCQKGNTVIIVTRLTPEEYKGTDEFLYLAKQFPSVIFILVCFVRPANYFMYHRLKKLAPDNLRIHVNIGSQQRLKLLGTAKVFVSLGRGEHFGLTIVESMSAGCTPIIYPEGGPLEIVEGADSYSAKNLDEAKNVIESALGNWSHEQAIKNSEMMRERFGFERFTKEFTQLLESVK